MNKYQLAVFQLVTLTAIHFMMDMLSGTMPGILPMLRDKFSLSIGNGVMLLMVSAFVCNSAQILIGPLRAQAQKPFFLPLGILLTVSLYLIASVPVGGAAIWWLILIMITMGIGVASVHPEGLRGICAIDPGQISPSTATTVFMLAGFSGYATGPLVGGLLVEKFDSLYGLWVLAALIPVMFIMLKLAKVKLASGKQEAKEEAELDAHVVASQLTFGQIMVLATLINIGCSLMQSLLPSYLRSQDFSLSYGGTSAFIFGMGSASGALIINYWRNRIDCLKCVKWGIAGGIPLLVAFVLLSRYPTARWLLYFSGMLVGAGFPQLVVLARHAPGGPSLGARMGLIVGGTWGIAGILLLIIGYVADVTGIKFVMFASPLAFLLTFIMFQKYHTRRVTG